MNEYATGEWKDTNSKGTPIAYLVAKKRHEDEGALLYKKDRWYKHPDFHGIQGSQEYAAVAKYIDQTVTPSNIRNHATVGAVGRSVNFRFFLQTSSIKA